MKRRSPGFGSKFLTVLLLAGLIGGTGFYYWNVENNAKKVQNGTAESMYFTDTIVDRSELMQGSGSGIPSGVPASTDSFYKKLSEGEEVNIAVIGDTFAHSVGASKGQDWPTLLANKLTENYQSEVNLVRYTAPSSYAYQGYCTAMEKNWSDIDLVLFCYGAADQTDIEISSFERNFEAAIRGLMTKNPNMTIMPMISTYVSDSNFSGAIREIADHYGLTCLNMNNAFMDSGKTEDELTEGGIYPNDAGYAVYADGVVSAISANLDAGAATAVTRVNVASIATLFDNVKKMDEYTFVSAEKMTQEDGAYTITGKTGRVVGIAYEPSESEGDSISVSVNWDSVAYIDCTSSYADGSARYIAVTNDVSKDSTVRVTPNTYGGAKFLGVVFSK